MLICCPVCGFKRELNDSQVPDSAVMATCPQCRHRFRFRNARVEGDVPPEVPRAQEADPGEPAAARARPDSPPPAAGHGEDDPLPPGAITPAGSKRSGPDHPETKARQKAPERDAPKRDATDEDEPPFRPKPADPEPDAGAESRRSLFTGSGESELAWETVPPERLPVALYQTILQVLFAAPAFYIRVGKSRASLLRPSVFYVLIGALQSVVQHFWLLARLDELASLQDPKIQASLDTMTQNLSLPMLLISMPLILLIMLLFYAGLFNLMIRLVQPDRASFAVTLRVVAYSAAPGVLSVVPVAGSPVAAIWFAFCCFVGCKYALNLEWTRTAMAFLPLYALLVFFSLHVNKMLMSVAQ